MGLLARRSFFSPILLLWPFLSVPRLWYFVRSGPPADSGIWGAASYLSLGFLCDGLLIGALLLFLNVFQRRRSSLSSGAGAALFIFICAVFAFFLGLLMLNSEFFRFFGSQSDLSHHSLVFESSEGIALFLGDMLPPRLVVAYFTVLPAIFIAACVLFRSYRIDFFLRSRRGLFFSILLALSGLGAHAVPIPDPIYSNLVQDYAAVFLKSLVLGDELSGPDEKSLTQLLDTAPLKSRSGKEPEWIFFDPEYPLVKGTRHHLYRLGWLDDQKLAETDEDRDGHPVKTDCNDSDAGVHPQAPDKPGNGIDEDCSGLDAGPPNVIFIHWEGARAVNVGSIGYSIPSTPNFDRLVKQGLLFRNAYSNATQTRWSITSMYGSILDRLSTKWICRHNPDVSLLAWPEILRDRGYQSIYLHSGEIKFSNLESRISQWFETLFDRTRPPIKGMKLFHWGITDPELFDLAWKMLDERKDKRPLLLAIVTLSLHYPLALPDPAFAVNDPRKTGNRIPNIMRYSDHALGKFVDNVLGDKRFENTVILIAADHGMNWYSPHQTGVQNMMWEDLVWVPLALLGQAWHVAPGINDEIRQLADIGPTILDRLGIEIPNPFIGHSLLRRFEPGREPRVFFGNSNGGLSAGIRYQNYKYVVFFRNRQDYLFDLAQDREENNNLADDPGKQELVKKLYRMVLAVYSQNTKLIEENRLWNKRYWIPPRVSQPARRVTYRSRAGHSAGGRGGKVGH